jgi:hypothetical protein
VPTRFDRSALRRINSSEDGRPIRLQWSLVFPYLVITFVKRFVSRRQMANSWIMILCFCKLTPHTSVKKPVKKGKMSEKTNCLAKIRFDVSRLWKLKLWSSVLCHREVSWIYKQGSNVNVLVAVSLKLNSKRYLLQFILHIPLLISAVMCNGCIHLAWSSPNSHTYETTRYQYPEDQNLIFSRILN